MEDKGLLDRVPEVQSLQNLKHSISMTFLMDHDHDHDHGDNHYDDHDHDDHDDDDEDDDVDDAER